MFKYFALIAIGLLVVLPGNEYKTSWIKYLLHIVTFIFISLIKFQVYFLIKFKSDFIDLLRNFIFVIMDL